MHHAQTALRHLSDEIDMQILQPTFFDTVSEKMRYQQKGHNFMQDLIPGDGR